MWQHDPAQWIGFSTALAEDEKGLRLDALLALAVSKAETYELIKAGEVCGSAMGLSIGFVCQDWDWNESREGRDLKQSELWEVSCCPFPMNPEAQVESVKGLSKLERLLMGVTRCSPEQAASFAASLRRPF